MKEARAGDARRGFVLVFGVPPPVVRQNGVRGDRGEAVLLKDFDGTVGSR
jgi:hypothetical protein